MSLQLEIALPIKSAGKQRGTGSLSVGLAPSNPSSAFLEPKWLETGRDVILRKVVVFVNGFFADR